MSDRRHRSQVVLAGLKELSDLLKRKAAIEKQIFTRTAILEKAYLDANQELSVTLEGRMKDIAQLKDLPVSAFPCSMVLSLIDFSTASLGCNLSQRNIHLF